MNKVQIPDGMIRAEEFARKKGLPKDKVVQMIRDGFYSGRIVNEEWFVEASEISSPNDTSHLNAGMVSVVSGEMDYKTSIAVAKFVSFAGWFISAVSIIIVLAALAGAGRMGILAVAPGIGLFIGGLILVIAGQSARAVMDNANYSRRLFELMSKSSG